MRHASAAVLVHGENINAIWVAVDQRDNWDSENIKYENQRMRTSREGRVYVGGRFSERALTSCRVATSG